jgi:hypothetical protein
MGSSHSGIKFIENPDELYEYSKNVRPPVCEISQFLLFIKNQFAFSIIA